SGDTGPQHLSLTTLFGKAEKTPVEGQEHKDPSKGRPAVVRSLSYEEPGRLSESREKQLCPAIQKLMVRGADLLPVSEIPENQQSQVRSAHLPGDVFSGLFLPIEDVATFTALEPDSCENLLHILTSTHSKVLPPEPGLTPIIHYYSDPINSVATSTMGKNTSTAPLHFYDGSQQSPRAPSNPPTMPLPSQLQSVPGTISPHELLKKLNLARQDQQYQTNTKPALAAKFPLVSQPAMKQTWEEKLPLREKPNPLLQVISPQRIPATVSPAVLLSPLVFTQTSTQKTGDVTKPTPSDNDTTASLLLPLTLTDTQTNSVSNPGSVLTKNQLQESLLHLLQNDESFLNTIYEAYLSILNRRGAPTGML
ncbi:PREDICTED: mRNA-decapping enzyme 1B, partial [Nanorana parkeri]|uniref:mRNA-decapping enzyme 1B n=1 Tax=Nanorana parkeri TaxID=125878 RepID=UPI000854E56F